MKLRNKKTGEIVVFGEGIVDLNQIGCKNVVEMIEAGWEDVKEPNEYEIYWINYDGSISHAEEGTMSFKKQKTIGNYFETEEEAEKAVEKLKAWKRLKEGGVTFDLASLSDETTITIFARKSGKIHDYDEEIFLLFGGKE